MLASSGLPDCFELVRQWSANPQAAFSELVQDLAWDQPKIQIFGRTTPVPRLTSWLGDATYMYSGIRHPPSPWHPTISAMRYALEQRTGTLFNSCLANYYRDGKDSVSWHSDNEPELEREPVIASVSLGGTRRFAIRSHAGERWSVDLADGDLLIMRGCSQLDYQHAIFKTKRPIPPRINLTFRAVTATVDNVHK